MGEANKKTEYTEAEEQLEYWTQRARAGKLPLVVASVITNWKNDREKLLARIYELEEGVPHS